MMDYGSSSIIQVGHSVAQGDNDRSAALQAAEEARRQIDRHEPAAFLVFATPFHDLHNVCQGVHQIAGNTSVLGVSTQTAICNGRHDRGVAVIALASPHLEVRAGIVPAVAPDRRRTIELAALPAKLHPYFDAIDHSVWPDLTRQGKSAFALLFEPNCAQNDVHYDSTMVNELRRLSGGRLPIVGCTLGDSNDAQRSAVALGRSVFSDGSSLIAVFETSLRFGIASAQLVRAGTGTIVTTKTDRESLRGSSGEASRIALLRGGITKPALTLVVSDSRGDRSRDELARQEIDDILAFTRGTPVAGIFDCRSRGVIDDDDRRCGEDLVTVLALGGELTAAAEVAATHPQPGGGLQDRPVRQRNDLDKLTLLSSSVEQSTEGIAITDLDGMLVFVNHAFAAMHGYQPDELTGQHLSVFHLPEHMPEVYEANKQLKATGRFSGEIWHVRRDGSVFRSWMHNSLMRNADDDPIAMIRTMRDITELRESEKRFRELFNNMSSGVVVFQAVEAGRDFVISEFNPAAQRIEKVRADAVIGRSLTEVFPGVATFGLLDVLRRVWETGQPELFPTGFYEDERISGWRENYVTRLPNGEVVAIYDDVTERIRSEQALRESEERLRRVVETTSAGYFFVDSEGCFQDVNQAWLDLHKYDSRDEVMGRYFSLTQVEEDLESVRTAFADLLLGKAIKSGQARRRNKDGSIGYHRFSANPVVKNEEIIGIEGFIIDTTEAEAAARERARMAKQVQHRQKMESLGALAGGIAHDFNNMLVGIVGNSDLAMLELPPHSVLRPFLEDIQEAAQQAAELSRQMLNYAGRGRYRIQTISLNSVITNMAPLIKVPTGHDTQIEFHLEPELPLIEGDASHLRQVVMTLLTNAAEAIGEREGVIRISTTSRECDAAFFSSIYVDEELQPGLYASLEVADTGDGISEEILPKIFDPFFSTKFTGRGLGLAALLGIVRSHGGAIKVDSGIGRGTTFNILLPASKEKPVSILEKKSKAEDGWRGSGTVLVVDDESTVRTVARRMLEKTGFRVLTARDGREGVDVFRENARNIDIVLLDLTMPKLGGEAAFRELREIREDVPIILSSGYDEQEIIHRFLGQGLASFIQKPYRKQKLLEIIREVLISD